MLGQWIGSSSKYWREIPKWWKAGKHFRGSQVTIEQCCQDMYWTVSASCFTMVAVGERERERGSRAEKWWEFKKKEENFLR